MDGLFETSKAIGDLGRVAGIPDKVFHALACYVELQCRELTRYLDDSVVRKSPRLELGRDRLVRLNQILESPEENAKDVGDSLEQLIQTAELSAIRFDQWGVLKEACSPGGVLNNMNHASHYMAELVMKGVNAQYGEEA
jgi:hypothetical protein